MPAGKSLLLLVPSRYVFHSKSTRHLLSDIHPQTPALLQLSGIGDSAILGPLNIPTLVDLQTVGRNLQEQVNICLCVLSRIINRLLDPEQPRRNWQRIQPRRKRSIRRNCIPEYISSVRRTGQCLCFQDQVINPDMGYITGSIWAVSCRSATDLPGAG